MSNMRSVELALRLWEAFRRRDWDGVNALVDPDAEIETTLAPGRFVTGVEAVELWRAAVESGGWSPQPVVFDELSDDVAIVTGALSALPAVRAKHDVVAFRFRNGRLVGMRYHATAAEAREAAA
jgi:ketosteroid isomerase-like protein